MTTSGHLFGQCCFFVHVHFNTSNQPSSKGESGKKRSWSYYEVPTATAHMSCLLSRTTTSSEGMRFTACATFFSGGYV